MTEQEKELLLKDLCARLPYGVMVKCDFIGTNPATGNIEKNVINKILDADDLSWAIRIGTVIPYLRQMSSMTDEEKDYVIHLADLPCAAQICEKKVDFFLSHHIDWHGLIDKGLALEASKGMYNF